MIDYGVLGKNIRKYRKQAELTQAKLAELVGCSDQHIGKIENAKNIPSLNMTTEIAIALDVGIDRLVYGELSDRTDYFIQELVSLTEGLDVKEKLMAIAMVKSLISILKEYSMK